MLPSVVRLLLLLGGIAQVAAALALWGRQQLQSNETLTLERRQGTVLNTRFSTIFLTGDSTKPRTANRGYDCRVDVLHDLWGFCPSSVIAATDCGLAGSCVDSFSCSKGCGFTDSPYTTFTCSKSNEPYCSTALLTLPNNVGPFTYLACGPGTNTNEYFAFTTTTAKPSSSSRPTSSKTSPSSPGKTATDNTAQLTRPQTSQPNSPITTPPPGSSGTSDPNTEPPPPSTSTNNTGAIIGGTFGCLVLVCGCLVVIFWLRHRNRNATAAATSDDGTGAGKPELQGHASPAKIKAGVETGGMPVYPPPPAELSARGPAAYMHDTAGARWPGRSYPPRTPVELPGEGVSFGGGR